MRMGKKIAILWILAFALLATTAYAKSFTDVLGESFLLINDFFKNENYKPYSLIIDFFVFSVVFMAIYMRGVKFAFKEVSKTEKALAVILGLTTAFLMILGDYSVSKLLPLLNWFLYFLLFAFVWWLLKGIKSKGWRFLSALLLTLLLILLFLSLSSGLFLTSLKCPGQILPLLNLLFAILIFIVFWVLLKGIKNSFGRFLLALLLTVIIVLIILALLKYATKDASCPESPFSTTLFGDIGRSFGSVDFSTPEFFRGLTTGSSDLSLQQIDAPSGVAPGGSAELGSTLAPQADPLKKMDFEQLKRMLQDSRATPYIKQRLQNELKSREKAAPQPGLTTEPGKPAPVTAPKPGSTTTPPAAAPKQAPAAVPVPGPKQLEPEPPTGPGSPKRQSSLQEETSDNKGFYFASASVLMTILIAMWNTFGKKRFAEWRKKNSMEKTIPEIMARMELIKKAKEGYIKTIDYILPIRNRLSNVADVNTAFIEKIKTEEGKAYLLEKPRQQIFDDLGQEENELLKTERYLIHWTEELYSIEDDFSERIPNWHRILMADDTIPKEEIAIRNTAINTLNTNIRVVLDHIKDLLPLTKIEANSEKKLINLLGNKIKFVVTKRIDMFIEKERELSGLLKEDNKKLENLLESIRHQLGDMEKLKQKIQQQAGQGGISRGASPEEKILQQLNILKNLIRLATVKKRARISNADFFQISNYNERISEMMEELDAALKIARDSAGNRRELISRFKEINLVGRGTTGMERPGFAHLWERLEFDNIAFPEFVDKLIGLVAAEAVVIQDFLNSLPGGVPVGLGVGGIRINLAPPEGATQKGVRRRVPLYERQPYKAAAAVGKGLGSAKRKFRAIPKKAKIVIGAVGGAAVIGTGAYMLQPSQVSPPPPPRPAVVSPVQQNKTIWLMHVENISGNRIRTIFRITDTNKNAYYSVAAYLEYPQTSGKWRKIDVTRPGLEPNKNHIIEFVASGSLHGYANIKLAAITEGGKTIYSKDAEVELK